jgi:hypothetical protein
MSSLLADGQILVIETEDDAYLGTAEVVDGQMIVRSGFVGRPVVLALSAIQRITPASEHEDID